MPRKQLVLLGVGLALLLTASASAEPVVTFKKIKFKDLTNAVQARKGKVVVVDLWATY